MYLGHFPNTSLNWSKRELIFLHKSPCAILSVLLENEEVYTVLTELCFTSLLATASNHQSRLLSFSSPFDFLIHSFETFFFNFFFF